MESALSSGLRACAGATMTSSYVLGNPAHKRLLYEKFHASIVDMETAGLARVAQSAKIPLSCIRVVSDEAGDTFLAPFSYDPSAGIPARAMKLIGTGLVETYREWKTHSSAAKRESRPFSLPLSLIRNVGSGSRRSNRKAIPFLQAGLPLCNRLVR